LITAQIPVSRLRIWDRVQTHLQDTLKILTGTNWNISFHAENANDLPAVTVEPGAKSQMERIILFSGGLDSACGAVLSLDASTRCRLVSVYTRDRTLQQGLAADFGHVLPCQAAIEFFGGQRCTLTRSFLYLSVAMAVASTYQASQVFQYENGVLGNGIAPAPGMRMTRHAHPELHARLCELLRILMPEYAWRILNPFISKTKRECVHDAQQAWGEREQRLSLRSLLLRTQSCWYHYSNHSRVGDKTPGKECGLCIPCLVRRTALQDGSSNYCFDVVALARRRHRKDRDRVIHLFDWFGFLEQVRMCGDEFDFYNLLTPLDRLLLGGKAARPLELHQLHNRFAEEFFATYHIGEPS
jgi:7-cyano-7-deazaguanine synthase in queuosine biosynthesis